MAISKEIQKSSEMKFDGKLIKVTYDIADVNGNEAWREVVHHPGATAIVVVTEDNKIVWSASSVMHCNSLCLRFQQVNSILMRSL